MLIAIVAIIYMRFFQKTEFTRMIDKERKQNLKYCMDNMKQVGVSARRFSAARDVDEVYDLIPGKNPPKCPSGGKYTLMGADNTRAAACSIHGTLKSSKLEDFKHAKENSDYLNRRDCERIRRALIPKGKHFVDVHHREEYDMPFTELLKYLKETMPENTYTCPTDKAEYRLRYGPKDRDYRYVTIYCPTHMHSEIREWHEPEWVHHKFK